MADLDRAVGERPRGPAARSWPLAAGLAAAAVYLPQLLPLVATDLLGHAHCLRIYARLFPVWAGFAPGIQARIALAAGEPWEEVILLAVATTATLALLGGTAFALRRTRILGLAAALATAALSTALSMFGAAILRA